MGQAMLNRHSGFTLLELVIVMLLLGTLAVYVVPRFLGRGGFDEYVLRDRLLASLRLVQMQAMQERSQDRCYQLVLDSPGGGRPDRYGVPADDLGVATDPLCTAAAPHVADGIFADLNPHSSTDLQPHRSAYAAAGMQLSATGALPFAVQFDEMGRPQRDCSGGCSLFINGDTQLTILINAEGYIRAQ